MSDKRISPKDVGIAVLKKVEAIYKGSILSKGETGHERGINRAIGVYGAEGQSLAGTQNKMANASPQGSGMKDRFHERSKETHRQVLNEMKQMPKPNLDKAEPAPMKGHIKLAQFMGRMEAKREKPKLSE